MKTFKYFAIFFLTFSAFNLVIGNTNGDMLEVQENISKKTKLSAFEKVKCSYNRLSPLKKKVVIGTGVILTACIGVGLGYYFMCKNFNNGASVTPNKNRKFIHFKKLNSHQDQADDQTREKEVRYISKEFLEEAQQEANDLGENVTYFPLEYGEYRGRNFLALEKTKFYVCLEDIEKGKKISNSELLIHRVLALMGW